MPLWEQRDVLSQKTGQHATVFMINGDRYLGEWRGNKKQGNGTYFYSKSGSVYEGEWANDNRNGYGTFSVPVSRLPRFAPPPTTSRPLNQTITPNYASTSSTLSPSPTSFASHHTLSMGLLPSPSAISASASRPSSRSTTKRGKSPTLRKVYAGEWVDDRREGFGTYYYEDGGFYEGRWEDDQKEGWGRMSYVDGAVYEGEWHREMRHGQGIFLLPNGDRYEGMWLDDQKEGPGRFIFKTKRQAYEGEWSKDLPKCGTLVDLLPLPGTMPRKYPIPALKLAAPMEILRDQKEIIQEERLARMLQ
ncbi:hypothetical protein HK101_011003 [Irineochytrium annulatum]|nr:hypothetical protein HK101_011003 [Irineochytrium annulatum]